MEEGEKQTPHMLIECEGKEEERQPGGPEIQVSLY